MNTKSIYALVAILFIATTPQATAQETTTTANRISYVWLNGSTGHHGFGAGGGFRWVYAGVGMNIVGKSDAMPSISDAPLPDADKTLYYYEQPIYGFDFYGFIPIHQLAAPYASLGYYTSRDSVLARINGTSIYYRYGSQTGRGGIAYGAGIHSMPLGWLAVGLGWHNILGFTMFIGVNF